MAPLGPQNMHRFQVKMTISQMRPVPRIYVWGAFWGEGGMPIFFFFLGASFSELGNGAEYCFESTVSGEGTH